MRKSQISRKTAETDITLSLTLDGRGEYDVKSGSGFLDHMLEQLSKHGAFDLSLRCRGDVEVDFHHSAEDIGICLGKAFAEALGDKRGIRRYGSCILPMDECLMLCAVDLSGRPYLSYESPFTAWRCGQMDTEMVKEFFYAVSYSAAMNLHLKTLTPGNNHHMMEAMFKAFAKALDMACRKDGRIEGVLSTKGSL